MASSLPIIINFFCGPCWGLLFFYSSCLLRFWVFFLSHTAPGFQLWFYLHLCMWVVPWGLLLRLPWRAWVCPCEGQVWRWCGCLGHRGSGSTILDSILTAVLRGVGSRKYSALEGYGYQCWPICSSIHAWRQPLPLPPNREAWQATVYRVTQSLTQPKWPCVHRQGFFCCCLWLLCPSASWAWRWHSCLACGDPGGAKSAGTRTASTAGVMVLSESFFKTLVAGNQKASLSFLSLLLQSRSTCFWF